jgi:nicotinamidase/pyrazinamidase
MSRLVFWDVDTQQDFIRADGRLPVPGGEALAPVLGALTDFAHEHRVQVVAPAVAHEPGDPEISDRPDLRTTFPPHCIRGTPGQLKIPETALRDPLVIEPDLQDPGALAHRILGHRGNIQLHKRAMDVFSNLNVPALLRALEPEAIVLYGVATDHSVRYAVEGLPRHLSRTRIFLVADAVGALDPAEGARLLSEWERGGIRVVSSAQVLQGDLLQPYLPVGTM